MNDNNVLVVSHIGSDSTWVTPLRVMMDSRAQLVLICKCLVEELGLTAADLEPCPFIIVTSISHSERATGFTREPLRLIFCAGSDSLTSHLFLKCSDWCNQL